MCEMESESLNFYGNDPGAAKFGNFINYYSFHSAKQRVDTLNPKMFPEKVNTPYVCLDIGCNTGELTSQLLQYLEHIFPYSEINILAIDIDPSLIERAQELYGNLSRISFVKCNIMSGEGQQLILDYLKKYGVQSFDVTFCFSVTMWIHLNNGDAGLLEFLKFIKNHSRSIILEPQPWHCYRNAQRRMKKTGNTFSHYESLKIRSDVDSVIENAISDNVHKKVYESKNCTWNRKIQSYQML